MVIEGGCGVREKFIRMGVVGMSMGIIWLGGRSECSREKRKVYSKEFGKIEDEIRRVRKGVIFDTRIVRDFLDTLLGIYFMGFLGGRD